MLDDVMNIPTTLVCVCGGCVHVCLWDSWCAIHMWVTCVCVCVCDCAAANRLSGRDSSHGFAREAGMRRVPSDNQVQGSDEPVREQDYPSASKSHVSVCVCACVRVCVHVADICMYTTSYVLCCYNYFHSIHCHCAEVSPLRGFRVLPCPSAAQSPVQRT